MATTTSLASEYVRTINEEDSAAFLALFAADAVVDDAGRTFAGREAIGRWSDTDIFAVHVRLDVLSQTEDAEETVLTTRVDGTFDRSGLPDPLMIAHHLTIRDGAIVKLACRLA